MSSRDSADVATANTVERSDDLKDTDVGLVIGASDIVNPRQAQTR